jgi:hypothetical protein
MTTTPTPSAPPPPGPPRRHHAFGWPAGSVRALLALTVLAFLWLGAVFFTRGTDGGLRFPLIYIYLLYLMILIIAHYFAARGGRYQTSAGEGTPLGLPAGSVRVILVVGFAGLVVWLFYHNRGFDYPLTGSLLLPVVLLTGFFVGVLTSRVARRFGGGLYAPPWFNDLQAWVALIAMLGLAVLLVYHLFVHPSLADESRQKLADVENVGAPILAGIVGFYFGARS